MREGHARIGLIGCGAWGSLILRDLVDLGCEVVVVARSAASRARARDGGAERVVESAAQLEAVDGVVVAALTTARPELIRAVLPLGVPVFTEKPLASSLDAACDLARSGGDLLRVMDKWRYHAAVRVVSEITAEQELGELISMTSRRLDTVNPRPDVDVVWNLLPHDLAITLEVLGELPEVGWARAASVDGEVVSLTGELGTGPTVLVEVSGASARRMRELTLTYTKGHVSAPGDTDHVVVTHAGSGRVERRPAVGEAPLRAELGAFLDHLGGGPPPRSDVNDGVMIVRRISELRRAAGVEP